MQSSFFSYIFLKFIIFYFLVASLVVIYIFANFINFATLYVDLVGETPQLGWSKVAARWLSLVLNFNSDLTI